MQLAGAWQMCNFDRSNGGKCNDSHCGQVFELVGRLTVMSGDSALSWGIPLSSCSGIPVLPECPLTVTPCLKKYQEKYYLALYDSYGTFIIYLIKTLDSSGF